MFYFTIDFYAVTFSKIKYILPEYEIKIWVTVKNI